MAVLVLSAQVALVNGTLEEVFWRGSYVRTFPRSPILAVLYPSLGFGLWHLAPQSVVPAAYPGGALSFVAVAIVFGLCWGWVAIPHGLDPLARGVARAPRLRGTRRARLPGLSRGAASAAPRSCSAPCSGFRPQRGR